MAESDTGTTAGTTPAAAAAPAAPPAAAASAAPPAAAPAAPPAAAAPAATISQRFPALKPLEEEAERAKLEQARDEARAARDKANLPSLDVALTRDTVAIGDKTTGLARVLVHQDAIALADDVADITLDAAQGDTAPTAGRRTYRIRVTCDPDALGDSHIYRMFAASLTRLATRIDAYAPAPSPSPSGADTLAPTSRTGEVAHAEMGVGTGIGLALQAAGFASKLFARDYQFSGREVPVDTLGFDLQVAHWLLRKARSDELLDVEVGRLLATPSAEIVAQVEALALAADMRLAPAVAEASAGVKRLTAEAAITKAALAAVDAQILELVKRVPVPATAGTPPGAGAGTGDGENQAEAASIEVDVTSALSEANSRREALAASLLLQETAHAAAQQARDLGDALLKDVHEFLKVAVMPGADGTLPPVARAARGESLCHTEHGVTHILYVRLIAGGLDQTIETKVGPDRWQTIAGVTAEFAVMTPQGRLLTSNVRSVLQSSEMKVDDPKSFKQERLNYVGLDRQRS